MTENRFAKGNTLAEYFIIFALVAIAAIPAVSFLGNMISDGFSNNGNIQSRGAQLFGLLNSGGGGSVATATTPSLFPGLSSKGQPVSNVYFNYNPKTGRAEVIVPDGSATGRKATSAEGTKILAQNMKNAIEQAESRLSESETQQLTKISNLAFELADMEKAILEKYPKLLEGTDKNLYMFGSVQRKGDGFVRTAPPKGIPDIYGKYVEFSREYNKLAGELPESDPRLTEIRKVIDVSSSLITQLAYENFIEPQSNFMNSKSKFYRDFYKFLREDATGKMVIADGVDITQITAEETPDETRKAGKKIETAESKAESVLNGGPASSVK